MDHWALSDGRDRGTFNEAPLELVDLFVFDDVPQLQVRIPGEDQLVDVGRGMHHDIEIVSELLLLHDGTSANVEYDEFTLLGKGEDEV